ncbi:MAG TPA: 6-carboxytetrahydropterin synthase [Bacteroidales bacterium]|nr:6-carboxytetrahydropterin synthase [Bacteroidales bacterium]
MPTIRITKLFRFEAAHALKDYDGPCRNIHGHSYELSVTIEGSPVSDPHSPKKGMVMDFSDLKSIVKKNVIDVFDHALILSSDYPAGEFEKLQGSFSGMLIVAYQPTTENMLTDFAGRIGNALPAGIKLYSLKLRETPNSFAEWFAE